MSNFLLECSLNSILINFHYFCYKLYKFKRILMISNILWRRRVFTPIRFFSASTSKTLPYTLDDRFLNFVSRDKYVLPDGFDRKDWHPKHMGIQMKIMEGKLRTVDLILEVHDARVAITGRNPSFGAKLYSIRPHILVLNKKDLVNLERYKKPVETHYKERGIENIFWTDCTKRVGTQWDDLRTKMLELLQKEIRFNRAVKTEYQVMVVGIPNVGKSSLINSLRKNNLGFEKAVVEGPYPGVTVRVQNRVKIWDRPQIYILDTPGVLNPWVHNINEAMKLAACNLILESSTKPYFVADYLLYFMNKHRDFSYVDFLKMDAPSDDIKKVLIQCCKIQNLRIKLKNQLEMHDTNEIWDITAGISNFLAMFRNGKYFDKFLDRDLMGFRDSLILKTRKIRKDEKKRN